MTDSPASEMTLGSLAVAIDGNIEPFIAKLAEARRIADEFDRHMATGSGGLLRFTETSRSAGAAATDMATKTGSAATEVNKLSDANERAARTSQQTSAALETEAQKTERLGAVVDRAIAQMKERNTLATTNTGRSLAGITSAGIPSDYAANPLQQDAMMGLVGGRIPAAAMTGAAEAAAIKGTTKALKDEAEAIADVGGKTRISSTAIREMIVLMREAGRGDFSRMAGSASLLAQNMGAIEAVGVPLLALIAGLVAVIGGVTFAFAAGSREATHFQNMLQLSGNVAGLTAKSYEDMARSIGAATDTSVGSNKKMIEQLAATDNFTKEEIRSLVTASQQLARATGGDAESILKDFEKMATGPTKYAAEFQRTHVNIISPLQLQAIRELENRGDKEAATALLIKTVTGEVATNTVENTGIIVRAWNAATNAVSNFWEKLKQIGATPVVTPAEALENRLKNVRTALANPDQADKPMLQQLATQLEQQIVVARRAADAQVQLTHQTRLQNDAVGEINSTYVKGVDGPQRYRDAISRLNNTLADSVRLSHDTPLPQILAAASKSGIDSVRDLATHYDEAVNRIKKDNLPEQFKADSKAAREAASEAKKLANEAAALERRRQDAISGQSEEAATLEDVLKLYQNHVATLEDVNRAKAITIALSRVKLTADSEEGRQLAELVGHVFDLNKAIADETNERKILDAMRDKTDSLEIEAQLVGKSGWALAFEEERLRALSQAMKDHIPITDEFMAAIEGGARHVADATVAADAAKFFDTIDKNIRAIETEAATIGRASNTTDYATIRLRLLNEAKAKHIELTDENISKIEAEARAQAAAQMTLNRNQRREQFSPTTPYEVQGSDFHALDQQLGGKFKKGDDLRQLQQDLTRQRQIARQYHADRLIDEKGYQERLTEIEQDGAAKRHEIQLATVNLQLSAAQDIAGSLAQIAKDGFGEQSKAYRAFFDIQKGFAIAQAALAMEQDIAQALSKGFPQNIPLIAQAAAQGAMIISDIRSIALTFADGGFVQGAGSGTSDSIPARLSNGEFVTNAQATAQWRPVLEAINAGRMPALSAIGNAANDRMPRVSVHNHAPGVEHEVRQIGPDEVEIIARRVVRSDAPGVVAGDMAQPNSRTAKAMRAHTSARPTRR